MEEADQQRCLWTSEDGYELLMIHEEDERCRFWVLAVGSSKVLLEWKHDIKTVQNVCCRGTSRLQADREGLHVVKLVWNGSNSLYCDYVTISGTAASLKTELVIEVDFPVSAFYLLWTNGLVLIQEELLAQLHLFDTGHARYLGYITLCTNSSVTEMVRYEPRTKRLWVIARKYDELTKNSSACLNTYDLSNFKLQTSVPLPRGFTHYGFVKAPTVGGLEEFADRSIAIYSSCELLNKTVLQWFVSPRTAWRESRFAHFAPLRPATVQTTPSDTEFQPTAPLPTVEPPREP